MPNGKMTNRDYLIEIHTKMDTVEKWIDKHEANHKWVWSMIVLVPPAVFALLKLLGV